MPLKHFIRIIRPSQQRAAIDAQARSLIEQHGDQAHYVARQLARAGRPMGGKKDATWTKVALRIAKLTRHEIDQTGADRRPPAQLRSPAACAAERHRSRSSLREKAEHLQIARQAATTARFRITTDRRV